ncbi:MAG: sensor histidine kinase [Bacteroidales bacterium]|nr:sensor histidine kinase [Bacteroidales bacterium]
MKTTKALFKLWDKTSNIGIKPKHTFDEIKSIRLLNQVYIISLIIVFNYTVFLLLFGAPKLALLDFLVFIMSIFLLLLNKKGYYKTSSFLYIIIGGTLLALINYSYGKVGAELYIIIMIITMYYVWKKPTILLASSILLSFLFILSAYLTDVADISEKAAILRPYFYYTNMIASLSFIYILLVLFVKEYNKKNKELENTIITREKQKEQIEVLLKELSHRTKNNLQLISSILSMEAEKELPVSAKNALKDAENRILSINLLHQKLYQSKHESETFSFKEHVEDLCSHLKQLFIQKEKNIEIVSEIDDIEISIDLAIPTGLIINELITNSFKHGIITSENKTINLKIINKTASFQIYVCDNGKGIEKLKEENNKSFGYKLIYSLVRQLNAEIDFHTEKDNAISIIIPLSD